MNRTRFIQDFYCTVMPTEAYNVYMNRTRFIQDLYCSVMPTEAYNLYEAYKIYSRFLL